MTAAAREPDLQPATTMGRESQPMRAPDGQRSSRGAPRRAEDTQGRPHLVVGLLVGALFFRNAVPVASASSFVYVTTKHSANVAVIDTTTRRVVDTVGVGMSPSELAVTPDARFVYVANGGTRSNSVSVIDTATDAVVKTIKVGVSPLGVAAASNGDRVYVTNSASNSVSVIETASNAVISTVSVGNNPAGVAITPDGKFAYVANSQSFDAPAPGTVSVIDTMKQATVATVTAGNNPFAVAITPNGGFVYVTNSNSLNITGPGTVSVIATVTNSVIDTIRVGNNPLGVALSRDSRTAYVTNFNSDSVSLIDTQTRTVTRTVSVGKGPLGIAITPDGRFAYVANRQPFGPVATGDVSIIDTGTHDVVATVSDVGDNPTAVAAVPPLPLCPGDCNGDGSVTIDELITGANVVLGVLPLAACPFLDVGADQSATIDALVAAVEAGLNRCAP